MLMEGISTDETKISAIQNFLCPKNHKELKGFLGLTNIYNKFANKYTATSTIIREGQKIPMNPGA